MTQRGTKMGKRKSYVDIARGIGIILVVVGHAITKDMTLNNSIADIVRFLIYTIHMPLFFIISGYLFESNLQKYQGYAQSRYIADKFKSLMIPYIIFSVTNYSVVVIGKQIPVVSDIVMSQWGGYLNRGIWQTIISILTYENHLDGHLWFCYLLFLVLVINRTILRKKTYVSTVILLGLYYINYLLVYLYGSNVLPDLIRRLMHYLIIFSVGRHVYARQVFFKEKRKIFLVLGILSFVLISIFRGSNLELLQRLLTPCVEIAFGVFLLFAFSDGEDNAYDNPLRKLTGETLEYFGNSQLSFAIYLLHMPFMVSVLVYIFTRIGIPMIVKILLSSIIAGAVSILLYKGIFSKIRIIDKIAFGNWKR